jgi:hypothetical protein
MSRYLLLLLLNLPFIMVAILSAITHYKLGKSSRRRLVLQLFLWVTILFGLAIAQPLYEWLYTNKLTQTEPLSLFDVIQVTAIVITFYIANRTRVVLEETERRLGDLHRELSIRLSEER